MKKLFLSAICATACSVATAQNLNFKSVGPVEATAKRIGVTLEYHEGLMPNGGKTITVEYRNFPTETVMKEMVIDTGSVQLSTQETSTRYTLYGVGRVANGSLTISGANSVLTSDDQIIVTRYLSKEQADGMPLKTVYTVTKQGVVRESTYETGSPVKEQVLP